MARHPRIADKIFIHLYRQSKSILGLCQLTRMSDGGVYARLHSLGLPLLPYSENLAPHLRTIDPHAAIIEAHPTPVSMSDTLTRYGSTKQTLKGLAKKLGWSVSHLRYVLMTAAQKLCPEFKIRETRDLKKVATHYAKTAQCVKDGKLPVCANSETDETG